MTFQCANCQRPFGWHCDIHVIPCCPGKCSGYKENPRPDLSADDGGTGSRWPLGHPQHLEPLDDTKENRHLGPLEDQSPGRLVSGGEGAHVARYPNVSHDTPTDLSVKRMVHAVERVTEAFRGLVR